MMFEVNEGCVAYQVRLGDETGMGGLRVVGRSTSSYVFGLHRTSAYDSGGFPAQFRNEAALPLASFSMAIPDIRI